MKYIVANWKAHKTISECHAWIDSFLHHVLQDKDTVKKLENDEVKVVICPPAQFLVPIQEKCKSYRNIDTGVQDVSLYDEGKFTGEIPAKTFIDLAKYAIIGHSERRSIFIEEEEEIETKIAQCKTYGLEPILCVRGEDDAIFDLVDIVAYEPIEAIGTGKNMPAEEVVEVKETLSLMPGQIFLYGGSVTKDSAGSYLASPEIDGLLVGSAALDPDHLFQILKHA